MTLLLPRFLFVGLGLAAILSAPGCDQKSYFIEGSVTLDGKPVEGATVTFYPENGKVAGLVSAQTRADGSFKTTAATFRGPFKVTISKIEKEPSPPSVDPKAAVTGGMVGIAEKGREEKAKPAKELLPKVYANPNKTPLVWVVPSKGPALFELESKAK